MISEKSVRRQLRKELVWTSILSSVLIIITVMTIPHGPYDGPVGYVLLLVFVAAALSLFWTLFLVFEFLSGTGVNGRIRDMILSQKQLQTTKELIEEYNSLVKEQNKEN